MSSDLKVANIKHADSASNNLVLGSDGSATVSGALTASGGIANAGTISAGTFNGVLGTSCDSNFQKVNTNFKIQRYHSSISLPNSTWTTLVDVDDAIANYSHLFDFNGDRFIATTYIYGANPGSGVVMWGVEAQNNTAFTETIFWRSGSGYSVSLRCVYNSATSIVLQMNNGTGYGPWTYHGVTEFWYYDY